MILTWSEQVEFSADQEVEDRVCDVFTYQQFSEDCAFDDGSREIRMTGIFAEQDQFNA